MSDEIGIGYREERRTRDTVGKPGDPVAVISAALTQVSHIRLS